MYISETHVSLSFDVDIQAPVHIIACSKDAITFNCFSTVTCAVPLFFYAILILYTIIHES